MPTPHGHPQAVAKGGQIASPAEETHDALAHELADCLWAVLVLAERYEEDLEAAYIDTMTTLEQRLTLTVGSVSPSDTDPTANDRP